MMKTHEVITHFTDDLGNNVAKPLLLDDEFDALRAVAAAAEEEHRAHCLLLTRNCPICRALAELDIVRQGQFKLEHN